MVYQINSGSRRTVQMSSKKKERRIACYNVQKFDPPPARTKQKHPLEKVHDEYAKLIVKIFVSPPPGLSRHSRMSR
jgi:hypothetical protein